MKKDTTAAAGIDDTPPAAETTSAANAQTEVTDEAAKEGEPQFDPNHEWPSKGGCYVRQADGTLKSEG